MSTSATKQAAKLDLRSIIFASLPFMGMISFWQVYDGIVPQILTKTFDLSNTVTGAVMAIDNVFGVFLLPMFGVLSDRCGSRLGRRTPFILVGSAIAVVSVPMLAVANNVRSLALLIVMILVTLFAICMYRAMSVSVVADITPRPLRTKANSIMKIVGYAGTGVMLVAIAVMVPKGDHPDYLPLFLLQAVVIAASALIYVWLIREPALVRRMEEKSREMGIADDEIDADDSPEAGGKHKIKDRSLLISIGLVLAATFFYYMAYNAMSTNISRYVERQFAMSGGSFAIINLVSIAGSLVSYVPIANLTLKYGRKRVAVVLGVLMVACSALVWLVPGFSPFSYVIFLVMGAALGGCDICIYTMVIEMCDSDSVGRYTGYYFTASMSAQVLTPILSGKVMDVNPGMLFGYITLMAVLMVIVLVPVRHGDAMLISEVARNEEEFAEEHAGVGVGRES